MGEEKKLSSKTLKKVFNRHYQLLGCFNYERQMSTGYAWTMMPALKELYKDNPEEMKKTAAQMPVTTGVNENAAKESDATVIQNTGPNRFRETTYGRAGGLYRAPFPSKFNPMPASEEAKRHEAESLNRSSQIANEMNLADLLSACEQRSNKQNGT